MIDFLIFPLALTALIFGAGMVIKESERIALHFDIAPYIIGATLVALGTSLPEMAASFKASWSGHADLAVANVLGSNILNISLVLALVFIVAKHMVPDRDIFAKDSAWALFPLMIFFLLIYDGEISRLEGFLFLLLMIAFVLFLRASGEDLAQELDTELAQAPFSWAKTLLGLTGGFILVTGGADFTVESASNIARIFSISEWIIGLLLLALGTSLPELVVSIVAARKGSGDMAIGNIIGSNMANFSVVLGGAAIINPLPISLERSLFDIIAVTVVTLMLVFITANKLYNKSSGFALLIVTVLVVLNAVGSATHAAS